MTQCSDCGAEVPPDTPGDERQPCPNCGSLARSHSVSVSSSVQITSSIETQVSPVSPLLLGRRCFSP